FQVWQEIFAKYEIECDRDFYQEHVSGNTNERLIANILPQLSPAETQELALFKEAEYRARAKTLQPTPGLERIIELIDRLNLKRAAVTNAPRENAFHMLEALNLIETFPIVVLASDAPPGKPNPDPYLLGLSKVATEAKDAIAFEDSPTGIQAAVAAGIYTIAIASTHDPELLASFGANLVIPDFNSPKLWQLLAQRLEIPTLA
ncbi:MAG: HAD family phosphatase, partial [Cyanobacteria bacterium J06642_3]